ncbi:uncharacterized protein LOC143283434 [Babylonia areolata]|uniref:uncharacterized protein LOC143283434 n=1 Tax=Babylonia areolata TaxID=304850 RepID=UPI003FD60F4D
MSVVFPALLSLVPGVRILVAGGTGVVGSGVVLASLKQGAKVTVATRSYENFDDLQRCIPPQFHSELSFTVGDLKTEKGAKRVFCEATQKMGGVQHVVASLLGQKNWKQVRMTDMPLSEFQYISNVEAAAHYQLMKTFMPYLEPQIGSSYTVVTGCPVDRQNPATPNPLQCLAMGAVQGLAAGIRAQYKESPCVVNEVQLQCCVQRKPELVDGDFIPLGSQVLGSDLVGEAITAVISSGVRDKVVISDREAARKLAGSRHVYVTKESVKITLQNKKSVDCGNETPSTKC